jgi:hypothetical protein
MRLIGNILLLGFCAILLSCGETTQPEESFDVTFTVPSNFPTPVYDVS